MFGYLTAVIFNAVWTHLYSQFAVSWPGVLNNLACFSIQVIQIIASWNRKYNTLSEVEISPKLVALKK